MKTYVTIPTIFWRALVALLLIILLIQLYYQQDTINLHSRIIGHEMQAVRDVENTIINLVGFDEYLMIKDATPTVPYILISDETPAIY